MIWYPFETCLYLVSSYYYAWLFAFGDHNLGNEIHSISLAFESIFVISIIINSLQQYVPDGETKPVTDARKTFEMYKKGQYFILDIIAILPLQSIKFEKSYLLYAFKVVRYYKGINFYNVKTLQDVLKYLLKEKTRKKIIEDPNIGEDVL